VAYVGFGSLYNGLIIFRVYYRNIRSTVMKNEHDAYESIAWQGEEDDEE
jgi:hypothetical protein